MGPFILIVFINDVVNLCDNVNESNITLFADDMTIGCSSANIEILYLRMNLILDVFKKWFTANKLTVHCSLLILIKRSILNYILFHKNS